MSYAVIYALPNVDFIESALEIKRNQEQKKEKRETELVNQYRILQRNIILIPVSLISNPLTELYLYSAILSVSPEFYDSDPYFIPVLSLSDAYFINNKGLKIRLKNTRTYLRTLKLEDTNHG